MKSINNKHFMENRDKLAYSIRNNASSYFSLGSLTNELTFLEIVEFGTTVFNYLTILASNNEFIYVCSHSFQGIKND